ncbi:MAG: PAS domain-containing protein [Pseudomonadota bacterium]
MSERTSYEQGGRRVQEREPGAAALKTLIDRGKALREASTQNQAIFAAVDMAIQVDTDMTIVWANKAAASMVNKEPQDLIGHTCYKYLRNIDTPCPGCPGKKAMKTGDIERATVYWPETDIREESYWEGHGVPLKDDAGMVVGVIEISRDVTREKKALAALQHSEQKLTGIVESVTDAMIMIDENFSISWTNDVATEKFGPDLIGKKCFTVYHGRDQSCAPCFVRDCFETGNSCEYGTEIRMPNGSRRNFWCTASVAARSEDGRPKMIVESLRDITERKRTEREIEALKQQIEFILGATKTGLDIIDAEFNVRYIDPEWGKVYGDPAGRKCHEYFMGLDEMCPGCGIPKALRSKAITVTEEVLVKEGNLPIQVTTIPFQSHEGEWLVAEVNVDISERKRIEQALQDAHDKLELRVQERTADLIKANEQLQDEIAERKRADQNLKQSEEKLAGIINAVTDHMSMMDREHNIVWTNSVAQYLFGPDLIGKKCYTAYHGREKICEPCIVKKCFNDGKVHEHETKVAGANGEEMNFWCTASVASRDEAGRPLTVIEVSRNITERKQVEKERAKLEVRLRQAQKMEAIGTLAGGIAHDFNNILSAIIGFTQLAQLDIQEGVTTTVNMDDALKAAYRAKDLVKQILTFSRQNEQAQEPVRVTLVVKEVLKFIRASLPSTIEIRQNIASDHGVVLIDPTQLHQVVMNLCTNAGHAMQKRGGILEVEVKEQHVGDYTIETHPSLKPGPYVVVTVSDTGHGMPPKVKERIFDPYFTTKSKAEGTGMGLAVVHGIVANCCGMITVESEQGKGTKFYVYFPRIQDDTTEESEISVSLPHGNEHILLVDDEAELARLGKQMLERIGYEVTTRTSSIEAREAFRAQPQKFDLVITDYTMPNMKGDILAKEIMNIRPDMPVILCTGYSENMTSEKAKALGMKFFLTKPILIHELATAVRQVLDMPPLGFARSLQ